MPFIRLKLSLCHYFVGAFAEGFSSGAKMDNSSDADEGAESAGGVFAVLSSLGLAAGSGFLCSISGAAVKWPDRLSGAMGGIGFALPSKRRMLVSGKNFLPSMILILFTSASLLPVSEGEGFFSAVSSATAGKQSIAASTITGNFMSASIYPSRRNSSQYLGKRDVFQFIRGSPCCHKNFIQFSVNKC